MGGGVASPTDKIENIQFSDEESKAVVRVASNAGTYVISHTYTPQAIQQAIKQGVLGIEHGNLIDEETAKLVAEKGGFLTPTLVTYATMSEFEGFLPPAAAQKNREVLEKGLHAIKIARRSWRDSLFRNEFAWQTTLRAVAGICFATSSPKLSRGPA